MTIVGIADVAAHRRADYFDSHDAMAAQMRMMCDGAPDAPEADPAAAERALSASSPTRGQEIGDAVIDVMGGFVSARASSTRGGETR